MMSNSTHITGVYSHYWLFTYPLVWAIVLSMLKVMRRPNLRIKQKVPTPFFFIIRFLLGIVRAFEKMFLDMGKILYHLKEDKAVSLEFNVDNLTHDELKSVIAIRVLESLKNQNVLDSVVYISEDDNHTNLI